MICVSPLTAGREEIIGIGKIKIQKDYATKLEKEGVKLKIERGIEQNKQRMKRMKVRNKCVEESFVEAKRGLQAYLSENPDEYKELLKNLICQSLIKMMEGEIMLQCRESDKDLVNEVMEEAI